MYVSFQVLVKRGLLVCAALFIIYISMFFHYLYLACGQEVLAQKKTALAQKQGIDFSVIVINNALLFKDAPGFLDKISSNSAILIGGFGSRMESADVSRLCAELRILLHNKSDLGSTTLKKNVEGGGENSKDFSDIPKVFEGNVSDNPFRHAIDADVYISINKYRSIAVFAPSYYMPKVRMLFEVILCDADYLLYFFPLSASEDVFGWKFFKLVAGQFNGYIYLKLHFWLNKYFKFVGFGKNIHQYF